MPSMNSGSERLDCSFLDFTFTGYRENDVFGWFGKPGPPTKSSQGGIV